MLFFRPYCIFKSENSVMSPVLTLKTLLIFSDALQTIVNMVANVLSPGIHSIVTVQILVTLEPHAIAVSIDYFKIFKTGQGGTIFCPRSQVRGFAIIHAQQLQLITLQG